MIALILFCGLVIDPPLAADRGYSFTRAGIVCTEVVDPATVPLTGEVQLTLSVEGEAPLAVEPVTLPHPPGWRVRASTPPTISDRPGNRQQWRASFRLIPDKPGDLPLPPPALRVRTGGRETPVEIDWQRLPVRVTTTVTRVDLDEARGITGPEPAPPTAPPLWMDERVWAGMIVVIAVTTAVLVGRGLKPPPAREPPLADWAGAELARLSNLNPADPESADALANLLRGFLARRFHLPVAGKTTDELITLLSATLSQPSWQALLERCDLARFANTTFTADEWQAALAQSRQLITESLPVAKATDSAAASPTRVNA